MEENNEIRSALEKQEQEIEINNQNIEFYYNKMKLSALKLSWKVKERYDNRIKKKILEILKE